MGNNLPIKRDNFVDRIKKWFKGIFAKTKETNVQIINSGNSIKDNNANSFVNDMKAELANGNVSNINSEIALNKKRDDEIERILKNPQVLLDLSTEKLELLRNICKEQERKYESKLAKLKKENS